MNVLLFPDCNRLIWLNLIFYAFGFYLLCVLGVFSNFIFRIVPIRIHLFFIRLSWDILFLRDACKWQGFIIVLVRWENVIGPERHCYILVWSSNTINTFCMKSVLYTFIFRRQIFFLKVVLCIWFKDLIWKEIFWCVLLLRSQQILIIFHYVQDCLAFDLNAHSLRCLILGSAFFCDSIRADLRDTSGLAVIRFEDFVVIEVVFIALFLCQVFVTHDFFRILLVRNELWRHVQCLVRYFLLKGKLVA